MSSGKVGGLVGELLHQVESTACPRCERCGCALIGGPAELMLCSTCLPAEVLELRAKLANQEKTPQVILRALSARHQRKAVAS